MIANDYRLGLLNGTCAVITAVDSQHESLTFLAEHERSITVPVAWVDGHLHHSYAMTCHKAQGATVDTALLYGTGALTREIGYVALSRGRAANHLYVPDGAPIGTVDDERHLDRLAACLAVSQHQTLAVRQLRRVLTNPGLYSGHDPSDTST